MAISYSAAALALADIIDRMNAGTITEAQAAVELEPVLIALVPELSTPGLASKVVDMIARMDGTIITAGPPDAMVGSVGAIAIDLTNKQLYGPKTLAGWGAPEPLIGAPGGTGPAGQITAITVATGAAGTAASIVVGGTPTARTLALTIPRGDIGLTPTLTMGAITTGAPGSDAAASFSGPADARVLALTIPSGLNGGKGDTGTVPNVSAAIAMVAPGSPATVTRSGPDTAPVLTFSIPTPLDGEDGREVEFNVSATHIQVRYVGATIWTDLVPLATLSVTGPRGKAFDPDATGTPLSARNAYNAEVDGFTFLDTGSGLLYYRQGATAGVWSDGVAIGAAQSDVLDALALLDAAPGVLVQTGAATFAKRAIGAATGASLLDRDAADTRYRQQGSAVAQADVTGLTASLGDKADAAAVLAALGGKLDADATLTALAGLTTATNKLIYATGPDTFATTDFNAVARTLLAQTTQGNMRVTGLGMSVNASAFVSAANYAAMKLLLVYTATDVGALPLAGGDLTGRVKLQAVTERRATYTTGAIDVSTGTVADAAISANVTISLSNLPGAPVAGDTVTAVLRATITGTPVITWPTGIKWLGGSAPTIAAGRLIVTISASWSGSAWVYDGSSGVFS